MSLPQIAGHELQDLIGKGSCGAVYRAASVDTRHACAVKVFNSMAINRKLMAIGMRGLQQMPEHPGILRPITFDFDNSPYFLALPLVGFMAEDGKGRKTWETPTLESSCGKLPADEAWRYLYEVCGAMAWLHKHNLVHCNLKARNVLLEDDPASATKIVDPVQGWITGIHHFESSDHFFYLPPEQAEHPEYLAAQGTAWDAYAFGVLAYRLLTGKFPRAQELWEEHQRQLHAPHPTAPEAMDPGTVIRAVASHHNVTWPAKPTSKWDERRKQIINRCLELDPKHRWHDLREVMHEFEKLEADFQIEDARDRIEIERRRQARKVFFLRTAAITFSFLIAGLAFSLWYWFNHAQDAERLIVENETRSKLNAQTAANELKQTVTGFQDQLHYVKDELNTAREHKRLADANLQLSQEAVDQFLNQLLQIPAGIGVEAEISAKQINDALSFFDRERPSLEVNDDLLLERARNYFNTAQLVLHRNRREEAMQFLEKARAAMVGLLNNPAASQRVDKAACNVLLGRSCRWLGVLKAEDGHRTEGLKLLNESVAALSAALEATPTSRTTRFECASAWFELGRRARRDHQFQMAQNALSQVARIVDPATLGDNLSTQEQFLVARAEMEYGLADKSQRRIDDGARRIFDAMESMVKLVERARPNNQEIALTLAESYIELGEMMGGKSGAEGQENQNEAMNILIELLRQYPQWVEPRYVLAHCYADIAEIEREKGQPGEAYRRQSLAIDSLSQVAKSESSSPRFICAMANLKGEEAELLCDLGKSHDGITLVKEAIDQIEALVHSSGKDLDALDRKDCGIQTAKLYDTLGHVAEMAHDSKTLKTAFAKSSDQWEALKTRFGEDVIIQEGLSQSKSRLAKLK